MYDSSCFCHNKEKQHKQLEKKNIENKSQSIVYKIKCHRHCYANSILYLFRSVVFLSSSSTGKEQCHTPDSPEGARVIAPRSPISPHHIHSITTMIPASTNRSSSVNRHNSSSPTNNGTPPPAVLSGNSAPSVHDSQRLLKIRRFLGALVQFGQDTNPDVGDRLRSLVLSLAVSCPCHAVHESVFLN